MVQVVQPGQYSLISKENHKNFTCPAAHLTCIGTKKRLKIADDYWNTGVKHLVALRGDVPIGGKYGDGDFKYATDLIKFLKQRHDFEITVSAYPEKHPDSKSLEQEYDV